MEGTVLKTRQWNPGHFGFRFSGRGTLYVQIPGKWHICDESRFPPGHLNLLCVVKIVFG